MCFLKLNILFISFFIFFSSVNAFSLKDIIIDEHGFLIGSTTSRFVINDYDNNKKMSKINLYGSYFINKHIHDSLFVQLEFSIIKNSAKVIHESFWFSTDYTVDEKFTLTYLQIPLFFKIPFSRLVNSKIQLYGGPFVGYLLKSNRAGNILVNESSLIDNRSFSGTIPNSKKIQYGFTIGSDFYLFSRQNNFFIALRYSYYISNTFKSIDPDYTNQMDEYPVESQKSLNFLKLKYSQLSLGLGWNFNLFK